MALVDYGSSTDEEEEEELLNSNKNAGEKNVITINKSGQHKRTLNANNDPQYQKRAKTSLPPLPTTLTDMFKDRERPPDNPEKHQGRIRARAHVDGSWPVHVFLEVKLSSEMFDIISTLTKSARAAAHTTVSMLQSIESLKDLKSMPVEATTAADATELHISLTRPLYLQELHLGRFTSDVRDAFKKKKRFNISFSGIQSFSNDEKTRSFLSLRVGSGHAELESLVAEMDAIAERYCQPKFYEDPQFHASFAWAIGGDVLTEKTIETMSELQGELGHELRHCSITIKRLVRVRSKEGTHRIEVDSTDDIIVLRNKIAQELKISDPSTITISDQPNAGATPIDSLSGKTLAGLNVKHGDLLYIGFAEAAVQPTPSKISTVVQDAVDDYLDTQDGLIKRGKDSKFCKHASNGMCDYCMPLEPYDPAYLEEHKIKSMSFHAYLRKLGAHDKKHGTSYVTLPSLEEPSFKVKPNCSSGHPPWPASICTKCQPSAITLQRQLFRLVDHVEFSNAKIIDNFINYWRSTGLQRFGYMYGRYEPYPEVPLGIKAVVEAIYEPPQEGDSEGLKLDSPIEGEKRADEMAAACGLQRVGMIYTDLTDDGSGKGTVLCKRHINSYFFSSQECQFAAVMQQKYPNATKYSSTGTFGSKFVTCVIGGNEEGNIDVSSYQVSNTCMGMVDADIVEPSVEPGIMRVKEPTSERYIPDVFFKYKNEYNLVVQKDAKPSFPVEYLLVNATHGFPVNPAPMFTSTKDFPVENRMGALTQDATSLHRYIESGNLVDLASNFHFLLFARSMGILNDDDEMTLLVRIALTHKEEDANKLAQMPGWQTLLTVLKESAGSSGGGQGSSSSSGGGAGSSGGASAIAPWTCRHCTFLNTHGDENCEMCGLPMG
ncbi:nuclear protein localization protein 4 [Mortierella polycephala]|uniref:Nuclear protein localization protein 4 n=1 Tax=Mortierella polycephala TaxID=41804 RepID=A0A9P6U457_9FUNG|nr:nuclear protein localization protein 4 [Mortierella polycephala]